MSLIFEKYLIFQNESVFYTSCAVILGIIIVLFIAGYMEATKIQKECDSIENDLK